MLPQLPGILVVISGVGRDVNDIPAKSSKVSSRKFLGLLCYAFRTGKLSVWKNSVQKKVCTEKVFPEKIIYRKVEKSSCVCVLLRSYGCW